MRQKLKKFEEVAQRDNVLEEGKDLYQDIRGKWGEKYFNNNGDIVLEVACGRGEYTTGLAALFPDKNFLGVDVKGDRLWYGSNVALKKGLKNVAFLRAQIQLLENFIAEDEISELWITFPDPRPRDRDEKRRVVNPRFMDIYRKILRPGGTVHLKTDNTPLFDYTLEVLKQYNVKNLEQTRCLYQSELLADHHGIQTRYETKFHAEGFDIKYLRFQF